MTSPYTHEEITREVLSWCDSDQEWDFVDYFRELKELHARTGSFLDERGEPLIEAKKKQ